MAEDIFVKVGGTWKSLLASKVDYALPVNAQTGTTYTFVAADAEKLTTASNGSAVTLTIPPASSVAWPDNTVLRVVNYGAGAVTVAGGSGVTVTNTASTIAQYSAAAAIRTGSDAWTLVPFGGSGAPAVANVSGNVSYTLVSDQGETYDCYAFLSSGSIEFASPVTADLLIVAGGGGGSNGDSGNSYYGGGGGGAGGYLHFTNQAISAGTYTVTVGAGGGGNAAGSNSSVTGFTTAIGGGQGAQGNGASGGSGGGSWGASGSGGAGTAGQGNNGANGSGFLGGGGGGHSGAGGNSSGGAGTSNAITGTAVTYARGGDGGGNQTGFGTVGPANTGQGGGGGEGRAGGGSATAGVAGGSGIVVVRVQR